MTITYSYKINGSGSGGQTWETTGEVSTTRAGDFMAAVSAAMGDSYMKLTHGNASYGKPHESCTGPYRITGFWLGEKFSQ